MTEVMLSVRDLSKRFGGLAALDAVSLDVSLGKLHAVIGPNGAGKTTLINLISGDLPASDGTIDFRGAAIVNLNPEQRARRGIGRSYQKTNIFASFTAMENCRLAAHAGPPPALNWWRDAANYPKPLERAGDALAVVGLSAGANEVALTLSHG